MKTAAKLLLWLSRAALCALIVLFVSNARKYLPAALAENVHAEWFKTEPSEFQGVIRLWNVYGETRFDSELLRTAVKKFERSNRGAFVEYVTISADEARQRLSEGEAPDVWIYPDTDDMGGTVLERVTLPPVPEENVLTEDFEFDADAEGDETEDAAVRHFAVASERAGEMGDAIKLLAASIQNVGIER